MLDWSYLYISIDRYDQAQNPHLTGANGDANARSNRDLLRLRSRASSNGANVCQPARTQQWCNDLRAAVLTAPSPR